MKSNPPEPVLTAQDVDAALRGSTPITRLPTACTEQPERLEHSEHFERLELLQRSEQRERAELQERLERNDENRVLPSVKETSEYELSDDERRIVFVLVQQLKAEYGDDLDLATAKPVVRQWWKGPGCPLAHVSWLALWSEFSNTLPRVRLALGERPIDKAFEQAAKEPDLPCLVEFGDAKLQLLAKTLAVLQRWTPDKPIYLAVRTAAELLDLSKEDAGRLLRLLRAEGLLVEVERGKGKRASRYWWAGESGRVLPDVVVDVRRDAETDW